MPKLDRAISSCHISLGMPRKLSIQIFFSLVGVLILSNFGSTMVFLFGIVFFCSGMGELTQLFLKYGFINAIGVSQGRWFLLTREGKTWLKLLEGSVVMKGMLFLHFRDCYSNSVNVMIVQEMVSKKSDFCTLARYAKLNSTFSDFDL